MKKYRLLVVAIMLMATRCLLAATPWDGTSASWTKGSGTKDDPYLIETPAHLAYLAAQTNKPTYNTYDGVYFLQTADLDINNKSWTPIGPNSYPFKGNYDGGGYKILNVPNYIFGYISADIKNITLAGKSTFPLINIVQGNTTITNCHNISTAKVKYAGIVADIRGVTEMESCSNSAVINNAYGITNFDAAGSPFAVAGGLIAVVSKSRVSMQNCYNAGNINISASAEVQVGGIVGWFWSSQQSSIKCCYNVGDIVVAANEYSYTNILDYSVSSGPKADVGGIVGGNEATSLTVSYVYNCGDITVNKSVTSSRNPKVYFSGLIGRDRKKTCNVAMGYNVGYIQGRGSAAVAIGYDVKSIADCYYLDVCGVKQTGGAVSKTEKAMKLESFVSLLNAEGENYFFFDYAYTNNGFPILLYQVEFYTITGKCNTEQGSVSGSGKYPKGTPVQLTATPKETYIFIGWNDGVTDNPRTIIADADATYIAQFDKLNYTVYVNQDCTVTVE